MNKWQRKLKLGQRKERALKLAGQVADSDIIHPITDHKRPHKYKSQNYLQFLASCYILQNVVPAVWGILQSISARSLKGL